MTLGIDASQANRKVRSGTEWYAFYLLQEFKKLSAEHPDLKVRLYVRDALQADLAENLPANWEVKILRWPFRFFWGQIRLSWEMLFNAPDVLFCPAHTIPLIHPAQTFTTLHDVGFEDYPELYDKLSLWYHKFSARLAVKHAAHIFTVSEFSKERIVENYGCDPEKITVTHLGIDKDMSIDINLSCLEKFGLKEKKYFLFIGRIEPKKNIENIIKAFEIASSPPEADARNDENFVLVLAGRKLMDLPDNPNIKVLNYVSEDDKWALLAGAAVFVFPTLYEGFGLPILEAQATKTPVITSNTASNPEIAGSGAVFVNPDSPHEISKAMIELISKPDLREAKIAAGLENIKRFSWENTAKQTWQVLLK